MPPPRAHTPVLPGLLPLQALPSHGHQGFDRLRLDTTPTGLPSSLSPIRVGLLTQGQPPAGPAVVAPLGQSDSVGASPPKLRRSARLAARCSGSPVVPSVVLIPSPPFASRRPGLEVHPQDHGTAPLAIMGSPTLHAQPPPVPGPMAPGLAQFRGLVPERLGLLAQGLSEAVVGTIQSARAESTRAQYSYKWRVFSSWCSDRMVDPCLAPIASILEFLQGMFDTGQSPQSLKVYLAAIASCHTGDKDGKSVGSYPVVLRFMQGVRRLRPPPRRFFPRWDLVTVLDGLSMAPFEPIESADLKHLSLKTALLLALVSGKRVGDLTALSVQQSCMLFSDDMGRVTLRPNPAYQPKVLSSHYRSLAIDLAAFSPPPFLSDEQRRLHKLCPVRSLRAYVDRTRSFRTSDQLWVCFGAGTRRGGPLSKQRLAHWIVDAIGMAYASSGKLPPEGVKAHSTRGVSTSWALFKGVSVEDMCSAASWSSHHTFVKYYSLDVAGSRFASAVLSSAVV